MKIERLPGRFVATLPLPPILGKYLHPVRGRMVKSKEFREYQKTVKLMGIKQKPMKGYVGIEAVMYQSRKKRGGDIDARLKAMYDALEGVMYINDDQIIEQHTYKRWDKENPRVELICYEI